MIYQFISGFMKKYNLPNETKNDMKRVVQRLKEVEFNGGKINTFLSLGEPPTKQLEEKLSVLVEENDELKQKIVTLGNSIKAKDIEIERLKEEIEKMKEASVGGGGSSEEKKKKRGRPKKA